jgi:hypothetical protein
MDHNQMLVLALTNVPTMFTVLIGILINNARINDLNSRMSEMSGTINARISEGNGGLNARLASVENRLTNLENKFDTRFEMLLSKVVEIDNRLIRLEAHRR